MQRASASGQPCARRPNTACANAQVLDQAQRGVAVAVVSDAGLPGINDPGAALVAAAVERGVGVTVLPGASAVLTAAVASGLPLARFIFCGFTAPKPGARRKQFEGVRGAHTALPELHCLGAAKCRAWDPVSTASPCDLPPPCCRPGRHADLLCVAARRGARVGGRRSGARR